MMPHLIEMFGMAAEFSPEWDLERRQVHPAALVTPGRTCAAIRYRLRLQTSQVHYNARDLFGE